MLAQKLPDVMNSWQWVKVRALLDHADAEQHGLFMSPGMALVLGCCYCFLGAALGPISP